MDFIGDVLKYFIVFMILHTKGVIGLDVSVEARIDGEDGSTTTLPCSYGNADAGDNEFTLSWRTQSDIQVYEYDPRPSVNKDNAYGKYIGRYTRDNLNLVVTNVTQSDDDTLCCHIGAYPSGQQASACTKLFTYKLSLLTKANGFECSSTNPVPFSYFKLEVGYLNTYPAFSIQLEESAGEMAPVLRDASNATKNGNQYSLIIESYQNITDKVCVSYRVQATTTQSSVRDDKTCIVCELKKYGFKVYVNNDEVESTNAQFEFATFSLKSEYHANPMKNSICIRKISKSQTVSDCHVPTFNTTDSKYYNSIDATQSVSSETGYQVYQKYTYPNGTEEELFTIEFAVKPPASNGIAVKLNYSALPLALGGFLLIIQNYG